MQNNRRVLLILNIVRDNTNLPSFEFFYISLYMFVSGCVVSVYVSNEHMADKAHLLIGWLSNSYTASSDAFIVIHCEAPNTEAKLFSFQKYEYVCVLECKTVWEINVTYVWIHTDDTQPLNNTIKYK